jgi:hypothetical protein
MPMLSSRRHLPSLTTVTKRFYYAEQYASLPKTKAKIDSNLEDEYTLQALTMPRVGERLISEKTWRDRLFGKSWRTILVINKDTLSPEQTYQEKQSFSSNGTPPFIHPINVINMEVLYAIPQPVWDAFISKLKHQSIVEKLGLRKHRHLWKAYNQQSHCDINARLRHAEWIGQYHFLVALDPLLNQNPSGAQAIFDLNDKVRTLTLIGYQDKNPLDFLRTFQPAMTDLFFKKTAHIATIGDVLRLAHLVSNYAAFYPRDDSQQNLTNPQRMQNAINWLPSSKKREDAAKTRAALSYATALTYSLNGGLFFTAKKCWEETPANAELKPTLIHDYLNALYQDLISREAFNLLNKRNITPEIHDRVYNKLNSLFQQIITDACTYTQLDALQIRWHINLRRIQSTKPAPTTNPIWAPLTATQTIDDITISPLTSDTDLKAHAEKMKHCVAHYTQACLSNDSDIYELTDAEGHCSTLEIKRRHYQYTSQQHHAKSNAIPLATHQRAATKFIQGLNNNTISINKTRQFASRSTNTAPSPHEYTDEVQEKIYAAYKELRLLPSKLITPTYEALFKKIDLEAVIDQTIHTAEQPEVHELDDELDKTFWRRNANPGNCCVM